MIFNIILFGLQNIGTKYRYKILNGKIAYRLRELMRQGCEARNI